jgi:hypothetical protein
MRFPLTKPGVEEKKIADGVSNLVENIQNHQFLNCQEDINNIRCSINRLLPGPDREEHRNKLFEILDGLYWDTEHFIHSNFREKSMIGRYHELYELLIQPDMTGSLKERLLSLKTNMFDAYLTLTQKGDEDMKDVLIYYGNTLHSYSDEIKLYENPMVYTYYQKAHADLSRALSFLPQLKAKVTHTQKMKKEPKQYSRDDIKKIQEEFSSFFTNFDNIITELDSPIRETIGDPQIIQAENYAKDDREELKEEALKGRCWEKINKNMNIQQIADSEHITEEHVRKLLFPHMAG